MFVLIFLIKEIVAKKNIFADITGVFSFDHIFSVFLTGLFIAILVSQLRFKVAILIFSFVSFIHSFIIFSNLIYFDHFGDYWSISVITYINQLLDVLNGVRIKAEYLLLFVDLFIYIVIYKIVNKKGSIHEPKRSISKINQLYRFVGFCCMFIVIVFHHFFVSYNHSFETRNTNWQYASKVGIVDYLVVDAVSFANQLLNTPVVEDETLNEIKNSFLSKDVIVRGDHFGHLKGKNLIFLQIESLSSDVIGKMIYGQEITPNLNELSKNYFYAPNMYKQIGGGHSSDAEFIALTSLYPLEKESVNVMYGNKNEFYGLVDFLKKEGYIAVSAHGFRGDFWNRETVHEKFGFDKSFFISDYDFTEDHFSATKFGLKDDFFYKQTVSKLKSLKEPFFAYLISIESHTPFEVDDKDKKLNIKDLEGKDLGNYYHSIHSADRAIGEFISELEKEGLLKNTTIVIFGDHDKELDPEIMNELYKDLPIYSTRVPFLIVSPNRSIHGYYQNVLGQLDILPTILHLYGVVPEKTNFYGRNVFDSNKFHAVSLPNDSFITNDYYFYKDYLNDEYKAIELNTLKFMEVTDEMIEIYKRFKRERELSEIIIRGNLLKKLYEE